MWRQLLPRCWRRQSRSTVTAAPSVDDVFLRRRSVVRRGVLRYRQLPFVLRMTGVGVLGFAVGAVMEVFACKTHLYEGVMAKKEARRHDFDEFVIDLRQDVERWQQEDVQRRRQRLQQQRG